MKIREILMFNEQNLAEGSAGLIGADLIRPVLDQIRPSNRIAGRQEQLMRDTPAAAGPEDVAGIEPPPLGADPMRLAPIATPPRWDIDRIESQVARLPRNRQVPGRGSAGQSIIRCRGCGARDGAAISIKWAKSVA